MWLKLCADSGIYVWRYYGGLAGRWSRSSCGSTNVCWRMLTYADACRGVVGDVQAVDPLTYADVCWRTLTYADACRGVVGDVQAMEAVRALARNNARSSFLPGYPCYLAYETLSCCMPRYKLIRLLILLKVSSGICVCSFVFILFSRKTRRHVPAWLSQKKRPHIQTRRPRARLVCSIPVYFVA
jgi:hypothetical protein